MPYLLGPRSLSLTLCSVLWTLPHVSSRKFDRDLTQILHDDLHWLDVADRVTYKLGVIMHWCRHGKALQYLVDCCTPVTDVVGRQRLRSDTQQLMVVPRHRLSTVGRRASANSRTTSPLDRAWKPGFSPDTSVFSALETFVIIALYKSTFTIPYHTIYGASIASCGKTRTVEWTNNTAEIQRELSRYWDSVGQVSATVPTVARQYSRPSISSLTAATFARHLKNHLFGRPN